MDEPSNQQKHALKFKWSGMFSRRVTTIGSIVTAVMLLLAAISAASDFLGLLDRWKPDPVSTTSPSPWPLPSRTPDLKSPQNVVFSDRQMTVGWSTDCGRTDIDFDVPDHIVASPTDSGLGDRTDLIYDACNQGIRAPGGTTVRVGHTGSSAPSPVQCATDALTGLPSLEPITNVQVGTAYCVKTSTEAVAWAVVTHRGDPFHKNLPTLVLKITLWR